MGKSLHPSEPRGYFGLALWRPKYPGNAGAVLRSAVVFGAKFVLVIGERYTRMCGDTVHVENKVPVLSVGLERWREAIPLDCRIVTVELAGSATALPSFDHPMNAVYVFGPEDGSVPSELAAGSTIVQIPGAGCLNLACAATTVMYDRIAKRARLYRRERVAA